MQVNIKTLINGIYIIPVLLVVVLLAVRFCTYTVSPSEYVVLTRFGKPVAGIHEPGLYFKGPGFLETVNRIDKRTHIFNTEPRQLLLQDKTPIIIASYICWRVKDPALFFQSFSTGDNATQILSNMVSSKMGHVLGALELDNIINVDPAQSGLEDLEQQILVNTNANTLKGYGVEVVDVGVRRLAYPRAVADAVYSRMRFEMEKKPKEYGTHE